MASTDVTIGYGVQVRIGRGATPTWANIVGLKDTGFPEAVADKIDATHHQSPNRTKEYVPGLIDNGEVAMSVHWVPGSATDVLLRAIHASGETVQIEWTAPGGDPEAYAGYLQTLTPSAPIDDLMMYEATFVINGRVA
jgi:hypothetical protein